MVLNYQGVYVSQEAIVKKVFGGLVNEAANCSSIAYASNGWYYEGHRISSWEADVLSIDDLIYFLANKYPIIIGLDMPGANSGHAYVLTAIYYSRNYENKKIPYKVVLRDPWPLNPSKTEISWADFFSRINCVVYVTF